MELSAGAGLNGLSAVGANDSASPIAVDPIEDGLTANGSSGTQSIVVDNPTDGPPGGLTGTYPPLLYDPHSSMSLLLWCRQ